MTDLVAGADLGGTTIRVVVCTADGDVVGVDRAASPSAEGGMAMVAVINRLLEGLLTRHAGRLTGVGVGAAGVIDATGRIVAASDTFPGWAGFDLSGALRQRWDLEPFVDNDVNCFLRGEAQVGAAIGVSAVLGISVGTGVGGALWLDGRLWQGEHGAAGEIGHTPGFGHFRCTCGRDGHLETLAAGRQLARRYAERTGRDLDAASIAAAARDGDTDANAVFAAAGAGLGQAVLMVAALLDVTTTVIGGGVSAAWDLLEPPLRRALADQPPVSDATLRVERARLGGDAAAIGAALGAARLSR